MMKPNYNKNEERHTKGWSMLIEDLIEDLESTQQNVRVSLETARHLERVIAGHLKDLIKRRK